MANTTELILRFTGDRTQLQATLAAVRADLSNFNNSQAQQTSFIVGQWKTQANERINTEKQTTRQIEAEEKRLARERQKQTREANRDIARMERERARIAEQNTRAIERQAKREADARIREAKRAARELERSLGRGGGGGPGGSSFDDITGSLNTLPALGRVVSQLSAVSTATKVVAASSLAVIGPIGLVVAAFIAQAVAAAALVRGLVDLTKKTADYRGKLFDLSQQLGITVETLSAFEILATTTGGSLDTVSGSLAIFQRHLENAQDPTSEEAKLLKELGVTAVDTEGALQQTLAGLFALGEGAKQTDATLQLFGRSGRFINAILKESDGDLDKAKKRFRELGLEISTGTAKASDELNDSLAELDFQTRATIGIFVQEMIPAVRDIARTTGDLLTILRPVTSLLGFTVGASARAAAISYRGLAIVVASLTGDYKALAKAIKEAEEARQIPALDIPAPAPVPLPKAPSAQQEAFDIKTQADVLVANAKRVSAEAQQALDTLFQQGRKNREQQADETIAFNKKVLDAEVARIQATIDLKQAEFKALEDEKRKRGELFSTDTAEYRAATDAITKLQQERLDKENEFRVQSAAIRARAAKEKADAERGQEQNITDILIREFDRQIKAQEAAIARGAQAESEGLAIIDQLELAKIDARRQSLEEQKKIGFLTVQEQEAINDQIKVLNQEADRLLDEQQQRRLARERATAERARDIKLAELDATLELQRIVGERTISTILALADARKKTEEQAALEIRNIRLALIDEEIKAVDARLKAAASIVNVDERVRAQAELNNQIKLLKEQRKTIEADGDREIEAGRQRDLENERRYQQELRRLKQDEVDLEIEIGRNLIRLMEIGFAGRRQIIRARLQNDIEAEQQRHRQAEETLRDLERENREAKKTQEARLETEKEINRVRELEERRHQLELKKIKEEAEKEAIKAGPFGGFVAGLATGQLVELEAGVRSFADVAIVSFSAVGAVVNQLAQGIGNLAQQWVLLGTTGPGALRKLVASVLAGVTAQAATLGVMELAYAIAALTPWGAAIYGSAAAHFKAAALFFSVAVGAGLLGRAIAGNSFQQSGGGTGTSGGPEAPQQLNPLTLNRNQPQPQTQIIRHEHVFRIQSNDAHIVDVISKDFRQGGTMRELVLNDGEV